MIYWDNNATTPLDPEVYAAMEPFLKERFFNPSAGYGCARSVREAVEEARADVAALLGAFPSEIVFTSGGTEATNMAFRQMAGERNGGIGVLSTDHDASLKTAVALGQGRVCPVDREGRAVPEEWEAMCAAGVSGVSFAWANNETGALQEAAALCSAARRHGASVHLDMVQCAGKIPVDLHGMEVDYASVSAHKFHGPKGAGCLYRRSGAGFSPLLFGGGQEHGLRSGTENVPGIVGMGKAVELAFCNMRRRIRREMMLRNYLIEKIMHEIKGVRLNGHPTNRLPGNVNVSFSGVDGASLLILLYEDGICASGGSACNTGEERVSYVIGALGVPDEYAAGTVRMTLSGETTRKEIDRAVEALKQNLRKLRDEK